MIELYDLIERWEDFTAEQRDELIAEIARGNETEPYFIDLLIETFRLKPEETIEMLHKLKCGEECPKAFEYDDYMNTKIIDYRDLNTNDYEYDDEGFLNFLKDKWNDNKSQDLAI